MAIKRIMHVGLLLCAIAAVEQASCAESSALERLLLANAHYDELGETVDVMQDHFGYSPELISALIEESCKDYKIRTEEDADRLWIGLGCPPANAPLRKKMLKPKALRSCIRARMGLLSVGLERPAMVASAVAIGASVRQRADRAERVMKRAVDRVCRELIKQPVQYILCEELAELIFRQIPRASLRRAVAVGPVGLSRREMLTTVQEGDEENDE